MTESDQELFAVLLIDDAIRQHLLKSIPAQDASGQALLISRIRDRLLKPDLAWALTLARPSDGPVGSR